MRHLGINSDDFFANTYVWLKNGLTDSQSLAFSAGVWLVWRHRNLMCLDNEVWSLNRLAFNIQNSRVINYTSLCHISLADSVDKVVKWNYRNHYCYTLNVDGSCHGNPPRNGFGGLFKNNDGFFISGFSRFITNSFDILFVELFVIFNGLSMVRTLGITDFVCYSDPLYSVSLINGPPMKFHVNTTLIQDIKDLIIHNNTSILYTLREGNNFIDFLAKMRVASNSVMTNHSSSPEGLLPLTRDDAWGTYFPRG